MHKSVKLTMCSSVAYVCIVTLVFSRLIVAQTVSEKKCRKYENMKANLRDEDYDYDEDRRNEKRRAGGRRIEYPHMVLLGYGEDDDITWDCDGTLISDKFVLTAGHCVRTKELGRVRYAMMGNIDSDFPREIVDVSDVMTPSSFRPPSKYNDIGLVKLNRRIRFSKDVFPACLNTKFRIETDNFSAVGIRGVRYESSEENVLVKVDMRLVSASNCKSSFARTPKTLLPKGILNDIQVCASSTQEGRRPHCVGDSGGPLQMEQNGKYFIVGVTSFGKECRKTAPTVFTRVSAFLPWIERNVWPKQNV